MSYLKLTPPGHYVRTNILPDTTNCVLNVTYDSGGGIVRINAGQNIYHELSRIFSGATFCVNEITWPQPPGFYLLEDIDPAPGHKGYAVQPFFYPTGVKSTLTAPNILFLYFYTQEE